MSAAHGRPPDERGAAIHASLLRGDAEAPSVLLATYYAPIVARLAAQFRAVDESLVEEAVSQAFRSYRVP